MYYKRGLSLFMLVLMPVLLLNSCGGNVQAPVESPGERAKETQPVPRTEPLAAAPRQAPASHMVNKGDTLYSIAWNYGFDYRDVAAWNSINPPYVIHPGQRIQLSSKSAVASSISAQPTQTPDTALTPGPIIIKRKPGTDEAVRLEPAPAPDTTPALVQLPLPAESFTWSWPTQGSIVKSDTPVAKNGIDIAGKSGQQINASAPGEVVYSGSGLLGYGKLIIIKHNDTFLSAYAHNSELLVKEGDRVRGGQNIALMGEKTNGTAFLHFEIRKNGQPVDPLKYLPAIN